jgi:hypothetical protein
VNSLSAMAERAHYRCNLTTAQVAGEGEQALRPRVGTGTAARKYNRK